VRPSAAEYKRAFLEKKGLTAAEIAEAFRRVPEPPPGSAPPPAEYAPAPPAPAQYAPPQPPPPPPRPALSWSQARPRFARPNHTPESASLARRARAPARAAPPHPARAADAHPFAPPQLAFRAGLLAGGALAAKRTLAPLAQPYVRQLADYCGLRTAEADAAAQRERAALAAASAALDAKASAVASSLDDVKALLRRVEAQAATPPPQPPSDLSPAIRDALRDIKEDLRSELRAVADRVTAASPAQPQPQQPHTPHASPGYLTPAPAAAAAVAAAPPVAAAAGAAPGDDVRAELAEIKALLAAGRARDGAAPPPLPSRTVTRYAALQGEAGSPATPADAAAWGSPGAPAAARSGTPGAAGPAASSGGRGAPRQQPGAPPPSPPPHSERYLAVLQAIESGQTPPGIRDIDDRAPNPSAPPPPARMAPPAKPWERAAAGSEATSSGGNGAASAFDGRGLPPAPWAARGGGVRITELPESGGENGGHGNGNASHRQAAPWVPQRGQGGVAEAGGWTPPKVPGASNAAAAKALGLPSAFADEQQQAAPGGGQQQADAAAAGGGG
jgi:hypothetical protein